MAEDAARRAGGHVALEDVQIGSADRRLDDLDDGVGRRGDLRLGTIFEGRLSGPLIDERFDDRAPLGVRADIGDDPNNLDMDIRGSTSSPRRLGPVLPSGGIGALYNFTIDPSRNTT